MFHIDGIRKKEIWWDFITIPANIWKNALALSPFRCFSGRGTVSAVLQPLKPLQGEESAGSNGSTGILGAFCYWRNMK